MKKIKYIIVFAFLLFISLTPVFASSFQPKAALNEMYDGSGSFYVKLWFEGISANEVENYIQYDPTLFEINLHNSEHFEVSEVYSEKEGKYKKLSINAKAEDDYKDDIYAIVEFKLKSSFSIGDTTHVVLGDYITNSLEGKKYKNNGLMLTINYHSLKDIYFISEIRTDATDNKMWLNDRLYLILFIVVIIITLIVVFLIMPANTTYGNNSRRMKKSIKANKKNSKVHPLSIDIDDISRIGERPKAEPKNKLELGSYNPLASNKAKEKKKLSSDKDFKESKVNVFKSNKK